MDYGCPCNYKCREAEHEINSHQCVIDGCRFEISATTPLKCMEAFIEHVTYAHPDRNIRFDPQDYPDVMRRLDVQ